MNYINYQTHLLLYSKNKIIINLMILSLIYISFYSQQITYCMLEGNAILEVAEAKEIVRPCHQVLALKREIVEYANLQEPLLNKMEIQTKEITTLHEKIIELRTHINTLNRRVDRLRAENKELWKVLPEGTEITDYTETDPRDY